MIRALIILVATAVLAVPSEAQSITEERQIPRNALYAEFGGAGLGISVNYERLISNRSSLRLGYGASGYDVIVEQVATGGWLAGAAYLIPVSTWAAERGGAVEFGLTAGRMHTKTRRWLRDHVEESSAVSLAVQVSYVYRHVPGGVFFRMGAGPLMSFSAAESRGIPYFSVSVGGAL